MGRLLILIVLPEFLDRHAIMAEGKNLCVFTPARLLEHAMLKELLQCLAFLAKRFP
jgi:hypothetical protein